MTDADLRYLESLAATVRKNLRWAMLLLSAMAVILLIDLQLKRSVAQQAVLAAERCARADSVCGRVDEMITDLKKRGAREREPVGQSPGDADHAGRGGPDDLVRDPGVAAGDDHPDGTVPAPPRGRPPRAGKRAPGNGGRAGGPGE